MPRRPGRSTESLRPLRPDENYGTTLSFANFSSQSFRLKFDGKQVIAATEESVADVGKVEICTQADSLTLFEDSSYGSRQRHTARWPSCDINPPR